MIGRMPSDTNMHEVITSISGSHHVLRLTCLCQNRHPKNARRDSLPAENHKLQWNKNILCQPLADHKVGEARHGIIHSKHAQPLAKNDIRTTGRNCPQQVSWLVREDAHFAPVGFEIADSLQLDFWNKTRKPAADDLQTGRAKNIAGLPLDAPLFPSQSLEFDDFVLFIAAETDIDFRLRAFCGSVFHCVRCYGGLSHDDKSVWNPQHPLAHLLFHDLRQPDHAEVHLRDQGDVAVSGCTGQYRMTYDEARTMAELLGTELAKRGYGIIVYTGDFIERDVVRGFVKAAEQKRSIRVIFASNQKGPEGFLEYAGHKALFDPRVDDSPDWEVSFYGSLMQAYGVVLVGGARSSLITGVLAMTYRIPVLALQAYGGSGEKIWKTLATGRGLATKDEVNDMAQRDADMIPRWVELLERQSAIRQKELRQASGTRWAVGAGALVLAWMLTLPLGYCLLPAQPDTAGIQPVLFLFLLFLAPMLSGASGATVRMLIPDAGTPTARTTALGMAAGAIAGVLYVVSHLIANPKPQSFPILVITVAFGFIAGLTFDAVFKRLESVEVLHTDTLKKV